MPDLSEWLTILIAFMALGLAIYEGLANRKHNRLSVIPRLVIGFRLTMKDEDPLIVLKNNGAGLAELDSMIAEVNGMKYDLLNANELKKMVRENFPSLKDKANWSVFSKGMFFPPNEPEPYEIARMKLDDASEETTQAFDNMQRSLKLTLKYYSIYKELTEDTFSVKSSSQ